MQILVLSIYQIFPHFCCFFLFFFLNFPEFFPQKNHFINWPIQDRPDFPWIHGILRSDPIQDRIEPGQSRSRFRSCLPWIEGGGGPPWGGASSQSSFFSIAENKQDCNFFSINQ
ncbi:hypothetical protein Taro_053079 [Colocasia esculenta]|uniref:Uncharacterized protein n=1 Tax=Colocasia esculenta TaxID=4460 RepID=A0A843XLZ3_COLES|nr:hypothetical protein [Colocasia esculenta]